MDWRWVMSASTERVDESQQKERQRQRVVWCVHIKWLFEPWDAPVMDLQGKVVCHHYNIRTDTDWSKTAQGPASVKPAFSFFFFIFSRFKLSVADCTKQTSPINAQKKQNLKIIRMNKEVQHLLLKQVDYCNDSGSTLILVNFTSQA